MGGKFLVKAGQHDFKSGGKVVSHFPVMPQYEGGRYNVSVQLTDGDNIAHSNKAYFAVTASGQIFEGVTDAHGYTKPIYTEQKEEVNFHLVEKLVEQEFRNKQQGSDE